MRDLMFDLKFFSLVALSALADLLHGLADGLSLFVRRFA